METSQEIQITVEIGYNEFQGPVSFSRYNR